VNALDRLARLWWVTVPRRAYRLSPTVSTHLADGHFLAAYPVLGAAATPVATGLGLVFGAGRLGYYRSFSESLTLVLLAVAFGFAAGQLGAAFTVGFAVGDFLIGQQKWIYHSRGHGLFANGFLAALIRVRLPMFIAYLLLASLVVVLPALIRRLLTDLPGVNRLRGHFGFGVAVILDALLVYLGTTVWVRAAAVLIRPLYTWSVRLTVFGHPVPPDRVVAREAVQTFQHDGVWIVRAAVLATLLRFALVWLTLQVRALHRRVQAVERELTAPVADVPAIGRVNPLLSAAGVAAVTTVMLAGLVQAWWVAVLFFVEFFLLRALSAGLVPPRLDRWRRLVARIPLVVRLAAALLTVQTIASSFIRPTDSFTPTAMFIVVAVAVLYLLVPGAPKEAKA
jgi:hypothetical protein